VGDRAQGRDQAFTDARSRFFVPTIYFAAAAFALASLQSAFDMDTQPWPLQLFMPLQLFFADLHSDVPLQEFTPTQCVVGAASAANDTAGKAEVNNIAAAAAIVALDSLLICMFESSIVSERSDIAAPLQRPGQPRDYYPIV
jgi:hypothetical protein